MDSNVIDFVGTVLLFLVFGIGSIIFPILSLLFVIYSPYRWMLLPYLVWIWKDRNIGERGGRSCEYVRGWRGWKHMLNYFQAQFVKEEECELDPKRNYLLCCFPHGIFPAGMACLTMNSRKTEAVFPFHKRYVCTNNVLFYVPFIREIYLSCGVITSSAKSLKYNLTTPNGGNVICLLVGGASEALYSKPNTYIFVLKKRKGFIRIALETGAPLLPTISFNETSVFDQFSSPIISTIQEYLRKIFVYPLVFIKGKYLICPRQVPLTVLVGKPIEVKQNPCPTKEEIDELHQLFIEKLTALFENNKHKYIENASNTFLEIV